jgi:hypothetical protein
LLVSALYAGLSIKRPETPSLFGEATSVPRHF